MIQRSLLLYHMIGTLLNDDRAQKVSLWLRFRVLPSKPRGQAHHCPVVGLARHAARLTSARASQPPPRAKSITGTVSTISLKS